MRTEQIDAFGADEVVEAGPGHQCSRFCRERLEELGPDAELRDLYRACAERWPDYMAGLTLTAFHERHALPSKRAVWGRSPWE